MSWIAVNLVAGLTVLYFVQANDCPKEFKLEIGGKCYRFSTDLLRYKDIVGNCADLGGRITSAYSNPEIMDTIQDNVYKFITSKLEKGYWWLGIIMDDRSMSKKVEDRQWTFDYDESHFIQKDFTLWNEEGGPTEKGLACAAANASLDFKVKAVDCGGPRIPVICMMKKDKECKHSVAPYLMYGPYCLAALNGALEYNKIHGACSPNTPTPYKDEEMKKYVTMCAKNSFLGGGVYQNIRKSGDKFIDLDTNTEPDPDMWEEGEPRDQYECVGLSLQTDNTLKLKTMGCDFFAASFCVHGTVE